MTDGWPEDAMARAAAVAAWGLGTGPDREAVRVEQLVSEDPDPRVRAAALGALIRRAPAAARAAWRAGMADDDASVRGRACELAPAVLGGDDVPARGTSAEPEGAAFVGEAAATPAGAELVAALADPAALVAEAAAFALGELAGHRIAADAVPALVQAAGHHPDALVREAAVAALGSLGDPAGLPAVLGACADKPAIRRRAVLALAAFEGPAVESALQAALGDRDWQVRQAAEDLLS